MCILSVNYHINYGTQDSLANSININYVILITLASFSRFWLDKPNYQTEIIQVYTGGDFICKTKQVCQNYKH